MSSMCIFLSFSLSLNQEGANFLLFFAHLGWNWKIQQKKTKAITMTAAGIRIGKRGFN